jgi:hypothetical protein
LISTRNCGACGSQPITSRRRSARVAGLMRPVRAEAVHWKRLITLIMNPRTPPTQQSSLGLPFTASDSPINGLLEALINRACHAIRGTHRGSKSERTTNDYAFVPSGALGITSCSRRELLVDLQIFCKSFFTGRSSVSSSDQDHVRQRCSGRLRSAFEETSDHGIRFRIPASEHFSSRRFPWFSDALMRSQLSQPTQGC